MAEPELSNRALSWAKTSRIFCKKILVVISLMRKLLELSVEFRSCNNSANSDLQIRISIQTNVLALLVHQGFNSKLLMLLPSALKHYFWFYVLYGFEVSLLYSHSVKRASRRYQNFLETADVFKSHYILNNGANISGPLSSFGRPPTNSNQSCRTKLAHTY